MRLCGRTVITFLVITAVFTVKVRLDFCDSFYDVKFMGLTSVTVLLNRVIFLTFLSFIILIITIYKVSSRTFTYDEK